MLTLFFISFTDGINVNSAPVQSFTKGSPVKAKENMEVGDPAHSATSRRGRFANLAQTINTWEDDLSHPVIK